MDTYFSIFSLPPHLTIDTAALEKSFYALSRKLHPDRFAFMHPANRYQSGMKPLTHCSPGATR
jgi:molecular chaperone HscB